MSEADLQSTTGGQSESAESQEANQVIQELEKRITDAFLVFDTSDNRQVDVRELGTVMRSVLWWVDTVYLRLYVHDTTVCIHEQTIIFIPSDSYFIFKISWPVSH